MSKKWIVVAGMAVTAAAVLFAGGIVGGVVSGVIPALAEEGPVEETPCPWPGRGMARGGFGWHGGLWTMFDTMAEGLGLTPQEFFAESHDAGKSLTEIAEEQGVDLDSVYEAMKDARGEAMREAIQQRVEDGSLSQEQADWMLEGLDQGFFPGGRGFGFGRGHGFGGHRGIPWGIPQEQ
jgi:predicted DNA-binding protein YlxM (UPF0122 family)